MGLLLRREEEGKWRVGKLEGKRREGDRRWRDP